MTASGGGSRRGGLGARGALSLLEPLDKAGDANDEKDEEFEEINHMRRDVSEGRSEKVKAPLQWDGRG